MEDGVTAAAARPAPQGRRHGMTVEMMQEREERIKQARERFEKLRASANEAVSARNACVHVSLSSASLSSHIHILLFLLP